MATWIFNPGEPHAQMADPKFGVFSDRSTRAGQEICIPRYWKLIVEEPPLQGADPLAWLFVGEFLLKKHPWQRPDYVLGWDNARWRKVKIPDEKWPHDYDPPFWELLYITPSSTHIAAEWHLLAEPVDWDDHLTWEEIYERALNDDIPSGFGLWRHEPGVPFQPFGQNHFWFIGGDHVYTQPSNKRITIEPFFP